MNLELTDEQAEALIRGLRKLIDDDRYPLSPRIVPLKEILAKLRPGPERPPCPRYGITSRRAGDGIVGGEGSLYIPLMPCWLDQVCTRDAQVSEGLA